MRQLDLEVIMIRRVLHQVFITLVAFIKQLHFLAMISQFRQLSLARFDHQFFPLLRSTSISIIDDIILYYKTPSVFVLFC